MEGAVVRDGIEPKSSLTSPSSDGSERGLKLGGWLEDLWGAGGGGLAWR
jgi:hypothetical protein